MTNPPDISPQQERPQKESKLACVDLYTWVSMSVLNHEVLQQMCTLLNSEKIGNLSLNKSPYSIYKNGDTFLENKTVDNDTCSMP